MSIAVASRLGFTWPSVRRALRSPRLIVAELLAIALAGAVLASVPQLELPGDLARLGAEHPLLTPVAHALGLDRVLHGPWLWAPLSAALASLSVVLVDQWRRVARLLRAAPGPEAFGRAAFALEFVRPPRSRPTRFAGRHRLGHLGSPLFHTGLMLVVVAGLLRALFGRDAVVDLVEGETLPATPGAFGAQWGGPLSRPVALPAPLRVDRIQREPHPSGALRALGARGALLEDGRERPVDVAINAPLDVAGERVYLTSRSGLAAIARVVPAAGAPSAILLEEGEHAGSYEAHAALVGGLEVVARASEGPPGTTPGGLEVRLLQRGALLWVGTLSPGASVPLPGDRAFVLESVRRWARFEVTRDLSAPLAFAGFALAILGAVLLVVLIPFDTAVVVSPDPAGERVRVALRPHRLPAVFEERFHRLVREEGGPSPA